MNEKSICIIKTKISHVAKTNTLKKVLFIDDKNMQQVHNNLFAAVGLTLTCSATLLS